MTVIEQDKGAELISKPPELRRHPFMRFDKQQR